MEWKQAKARAQEWIESLNLPQNLKGQTIHLHRLSETLREPLLDKLIILRAAARILKRRGAKVDLHSDSRSSVQSKRRKL
jgi:hypothetical protein